MSTIVETGSPHAERVGHFEVSNASSAPPSSVRRSRPSREVVEQQNQSNDDTDANSNGSSGNESNGHESNGNESNRAESRGLDSRSSHSSTSGNGKDSALLETTESNKSTNSQSPSPPSSSIAYSLLSASSEQDNPSTSGCSSEQSAREKTQKELMKALKELKIRLPSEKRGKGKSGTLATLQYALSCVKQVRANQEYYQQWTVDDSQPCCLDMSSYTIEELENITSEYTLKNQDTFSVAVSFITGKIVYISDQADFILRCKRDVFKGATFAEFLAPQDVSVFYGSTAPFHLPSWSACTSADAAPMDYTQEKSVFCRIRCLFHSGGRGREHELRYYPFRLTPYLTKVRDSDNAEGQPSCLLIAERVHSGYEAPRIPADKRIFTTRHTPSCMFQEVDERAVPLLGYLPQDLIGMPVLFFVHPEDRPLMLSIHKKILQYAGQPFDHCPIRFCARNGEYVTIDTSWSSFVNPWSRKVSFILGRHKVRTGPLNEDVFTAPKGSEMKPLDTDIQELSEQIHRILLQPVHSTNTGNGSGGSNASQEHLRSNASSSDGNGQHADELKALKPMTFQQFYQDVHTVKHQGQQMFIESRLNIPPQNPSIPVLAPPKPIIPQTMQSRRDTGMSLGKAVTSEESLRKEPSNYSYQQINCLDSIIRYLDSCNTPYRMKRKCGSSSYATSSTSDDDKQKHAKEACGKKKDCTEEVMAATDSSSKRQDPKTSAAAVVGAPLTPLALPSKAESVVSITSQCSFSSTIVHVGDKKPPESDIVMMEETPSTPVPAPPPTPSVAQDKDQYRKVGLTKEVLSIHTQKEEQAFLTRFKDLSQLHVFDPPTGLGRQEPRHSGQHADKGRRGSRHNSGGGGGPGSSRRGKSGKSKPKRLKHQKAAENTMSPPNSNSHSLHPAAGLPSSSWPPSGTSQANLPTMPYPTVMPGYSIPMFSARTSMTPVSEPNQGPFANGQNSQGMRYPLAPPQYPAPMVTPMVALVLPNYMFPQMNNAMPQPFFSSQSSFGGPVFPFTAPPPVQMQGNPMPPPAEPTHPASRSTTPHSMSQPDGSESPLFESRCSSPLQLNLLQMEETPKSSDRLEGGGASNLGAGTGSNVDWNAASTGPGTVNDVNQTEACMGEVNESSNNDALSSSSDLLDLLLQEDSQSGTGSAASGSRSAASGSMGSGSNGESTSACGTRSSSSNTSNYFGSIDSSENDHRAKKQALGMKEDERMLIKYVMQDPIWLLMANADEKVMMSYQIPKRDMDKVLQEDREKLKQMHKYQPKFTEEQKRELAEVHPWMKKGLLPKAIDITACGGCGSSSYDYDIDMTMMLEAMEEGGCGGSQSSTFPPISEVAMEEEESGQKADLGSQQQQPLQQRQQHQHQGNS